MIGDKIYFFKKKENLIWSNLVLWSWARDTTKDLVKFLSVFTDAVMEENSIKKARRKGIWAVYNPTDSTS